MKLVIQRKYKKGGAWVDVYIDPICVPPEPSLKYLKKHCTNLAKNNNCFEYRIVEKLDKVVFFVSRDTIPLERVTIEKRFQNLPWVKILETDDKPEEIVRLIRLGNLWQKIDDNCEFRIKHSSRGVIYNTGETDANPEES